METPESNQFSGLVKTYVEKLSMCVLPLLFRNKRESSHAGTGFLVSTGSNDYLVSAKHVFEPLLNGQDLFYYVGNNKILKLASAIYRLHEMYDVAVLKLSNEYRPPYPEINKYSLKFECLGPGILPRQYKQYVVTGFPATRTCFNKYNKQVSSELRPFMSRALSYYQYKATEVNPQEFLLLAFQQKTFFVQGGRQVTFPDPHGLSGSPVWLSYDEINRNDLKMTPLVGIIVEHDSAKKFVKACDIGYATTLIKQLETAT